MTTVLLRPGQQLTPATAGLLDEWGASLRQKDRETRITLAQNRSQWIDRAMLDLQSPIDTVAAKAVQDLAAAGLTAFDIPVIQGWLHDVASTGEVP